jgi:hypothetical protein
MCQTLINSVKFIPKPLIKWKAATKKRNPDQGKKTATFSFSRPPSFKG